MRMATNVALLAAFVAASVGGVAVFGTSVADPETSVVTPWQQAWEVPNLFLMDGSVLPTGGAVNPTPTIQAVALRAADRIRASLGRAGAAPRDCCGLAYSGVYEPRIDVSSQPVIREMPPGFVRR